MARNLVTVVNLIFCIGQNARIRMAIASDTTDIRETSGKRFSD